MITKPRKFLCPTTGENCVEGECTLTRCIQRERDAAALAHAKEAALQWRIAHPEHLTDEDLKDMGL